MTKKKPSLPCASRTPCVLRSLIEDAERRRDAEQYGTIEYYELDWLVHSLETDLARLTRKKPRLPWSRKRIEDPAYLARVRGLPCWACEMDGTYYGPSEAHHPREGEGMATKADDSEAISLCSRHHNEQHPDTFSIHRNPIEFQARYGTEADLTEKTKQRLRDGWEDLY